MLDRLKAAAVSEHMDLLVFKFDKLEGKRNGVYTFSVYGNWRVTFKFDGDNVFEVVPVVYH